MRQIISRYQGVIKGGISLLIIAYAFFLLSENKHLMIDVVQEFGRNSKRLPILFFPFVLIALNWGLEALKWKILVERIEKISIWQAMEGVLTGLSMGFVTPHSVGDYIGRIIQLSQKKRGRVVGALMVSRLSQLLSTLVVGLTGLMVYASQGMISLASKDQINFTVVVVMLVVLVMAFLFRVRIISFLARLSALDKVVRLIEIVKEYKAEVITRVALLSFLRYLVFSAQFLLVFWFFDFSQDWILLFFGVSIVFLIKSVFVSFNFLTDLGVRGVAAVYFLCQLGVSEEKAIAASFLVWLLNILTPSLAGSVLLLKAKLVVKK